LIINEIKRRLHLLLLPTKFSAQFNSLERQLCLKSYFPPAPIKIAFAFFACILLLFNLLAILPAGQKDPATRLQIQARKRYWNRGPAANERNA